MTALAPHFALCGSKYAFRGTVMLRFRVAPSGKITSVTARHDSDPFAGCLVAPMKSVRLPTSRHGAAIDYPVVLR